MQSEPQRAQTVENNASLRLEMEVEHSLQGLELQQAPAVQLDSLLALLEVAASRGGRNTLRWPLLELSCAVPACSTSQLSAV